MCRPVTCRKCNRPDWRGCGLHVEQVLGHVPEADRCQCRNQPAGSGDRRGGHGLLGWLRR